MEIAWETDDGLTQRIVFDAWIRSGHESSGELTERKIEKGANIADHYRPNQDTIKVDAEVTNTPIDVPETQMDGAIGAVQSVDLASGGKASMLQFDRPFNRVRRVYETLHQLSENGTLVRILTTLREYEDMVILDLSSPEEGRDAVEFSFSAKQARFASTQIVQAPLPKVTRGNLQQNRGPQPGEQETDANKQSLLSKLLGG